MSRLASGLSDELKLSSTYQTITLRPSPKDKSLTLIHLAGHAIDARPLYTAIVASENVSVYRGHLAPVNLIGTADSSSLTLHGQHAKMKTSQMSGNLSMEWPPTGTLKWNPDMLTGSSLELSDNFGRNLAKFKATSMLKPSEKVIEMQVPWPQRRLRGRTWKLPRRSCRR
jgi:hypothetical protein